MPCFPCLTSKIAEEDTEVLHAVQSTIPSTFTQHLREVAVLFEHGARAFLIPAKEERCDEGRRHNFRIIHLTLGVFWMMHGFQQIVTQAACRSNCVVHGLAPLAVKWVISPVM